MAQSPDTWPSPKIESWGDLDAFRRSDLAWRAAGGKGVASSDLTSGIVDVLTILHADVGVGLPLIHLDHIIAPWWHAAGVRTYGDTMVKDAETFASRLEAVEPRALGLLRAFPGRLALAGGAAMQLACFEAEKFDPNSDIDMFPMVDSGAAVRALIDDIWRFAHT